MKSYDQLQRYLFENVQVRGEIVQLQQSYESMLVNHDYPDSIKQILGELLTATSLLTATLKFEGDITVQLQGDGPVKYVAINGNNKLELRGVARFDAEPASANLSDIVGKGYLVITITPTKGERYQGIVALEHETIAQCLETYFIQSEQLATSISLYTDTRTAKTGGIFLQTMPSVKEEAKTEFDHLVQLTSTMKTDEFFSLEAQDVLYRLYHQEEVKLFESTKVIFKCGCSKDKTLNAIASIAPEEIKSILAEQGKIEVKCEYCLENYSFASADLLSLTQITPEQ